MSLFKKPWMRKAVGKAARAAKDPRVREGAKYVLEQEIKPRVKTALEKAQPEVEAASEREQSRAEAARKEEFEGSAGPTRGGKTIKGLLRGLNARRAPTADSGSQVQQAKGVRRRFERPTEAAADPGSGAKPRKGLLRRLKPRKAPAADSGNQVRQGKGLLGRFGSRTEEAADAGGRVKKVVGVLGELKPLIEEAADPGGGVKQGIKLLVLLKPLIGLVTGLVSKFHAMRLLACGCLLGCAAIVVIFAALMFLAGMWWCERI